MNLIQQGTHPQYGSYTHALLPVVEQGVTHILAVCSGKTFLHSILATGEVVSQEMNLSLVRNILSAIDSMVIPQ